MDFDRFELLVVVLSIIDILAESLDIPSTGYLRVFRLLRLIRVMEAMRALRYCISSSHVWSTILHCINACVAYGTALHQAMCGLCL